MLDVLNKANNFIKEKEASVITDFRNKYHLMAPIGWINDPNGFIFYEGEYHLFYQHYPYDSVWGPMHWGHAKSKDLVSWEHLPVALAPSEDYDKDGCFSGSALVEDGKLYLYYTGHVVNEGVVRQVQCVAVSEDGIHFEKHRQNPIVDERHIEGIAPIADFRDPKVFKKDDIYYMVVATKTADDRGQILMFNSTNLIDWEFFSVLLEGQKHQGVMWECPDLFYLDGKDVLIMSPMGIKGRGHEFKNVSSTVAFIGSVDWVTGKFQVENDHEIDGGLDFYAPQTCTGPNGERVMSAWMQMWGRNMPTNELAHSWAGSMTLPRELHVQNNRLIQKPIHTIYHYIQHTDELRDLKVQDEQMLKEQVMSDQSYLRLELGVAETKHIRMELMKSNSGSLKITYDVANELFEVSRAGLGHEIKGDEPEHLTSRSLNAPFVDERITIEVFRDTSSIEIFINESAAMTFTFYELEKGRDFILDVLGSVHIHELVIGRLQIN